MEDRGREIKGILTIMSCIATIDHSNHPKTPIELPENLIRNSETPSKHSNTDYDCDADTSRSHKPIFIQNVLN